MSGRAWVVRRRGNGGPREICGGTSNIRTSEHPTSKRRRGGRGRGGVMEMVAWASFAAEHRTSEHRNIQHRREEEAGVEGEASWKWWPGRALRRNIEHQNIGTSNIEEKKRRAWKGRRRGNGGPEICGGTSNIGTSEHPTSKRRRHGRGWRDAVEIVARARFAAQHRTRSPLANQYGLVLRRFVNRHVETICKDNSSVG